MVYAQKNVMIKNGSVSLNTKIYAADKSETIILLHGGPGVPDDMTAVVNVLRKHFRVIIFEQRGVGQSTCQKCTFTMEDYIADIDSIAEYYNLDKFHLLGHSWGGLYAQIYAIERPDKIKSLFLCSPSSGTNELWKKTEKEVMQFNKRIASNTEWISMGWNSLLGMLGSDKAYQKVFKQVLENYHKGYCEIEVDKDLLSKIHAKPINKTRKEIVKYKPLPQLTSPEFPIRITYGDHDIYGDSKELLLQRYPTARVSVLNHCGHLPWEHQPEAFEMILNDFYSIN